MLKKFLSIITVLSMVVGMVQLPVFAAADDLTCEIIDVFEYTPYNETGETSRSEITLKFSENVDGTDISSKVKVRKLSNGEDLSVASVTVTDNEAVITHTPADGGYAVELSGVTNSDANKNLTATLKTPSYADDSITLNRSLNLGVARDQSTNYLNKSIQTAGWVWIDDNHSESQENATEREMMEADASFEDGKYVVLKFEVDMSDDNTGRNVLVQYLRGGTRESLFMLERQATGNVRFESWSNDREGWTEVERTDGDKYKIEIAFERYNGCWWIETQINDKVYKEIYKTDTNALKGVCIYEYPDEVPGPNSLGQAGNAAPGATGGVALVDATFGWSATNDGYRVTSVDWKLADGTYVIADANEAVAGPVGYRYNFGRYMKMGDFGSHLGFWEQGSVPTGTSNRNYGTWSQEGGTYTKTEEWGFGGDNNVYMDADKTYELIRNVSSDCTTPHPNYTGIMKTAPAQLVVKGIKIADNVAKLTGYNWKDAGESAMLYGVYDEVTGVLKDAGVAEVTYSASDVDLEDVNSNTLKVPACEDGEIIRVFAFDDLGTLKPLCDSVKMEYAAEDQ